MHSICLLFGYNSLLVGVLRLYTHVYILFAFFGSNSLLAGVLRLDTHVYTLFASFLGLTHFLQMFCTCIPKYTFYFFVIEVSLTSCRCFAHLYPRIHFIIFLIGSNSLLLRVLLLYTHVYTFYLLAFWV